MKANKKYLKNGKTYIFTPKDIDTLKKNEISDSVVESRMKSGWGIHRICNQRIDMTSEEYFDWLRMKRENVERKRLKRIKEKLREERLLKQKAHLTKYPQSVKPSSYYHNLLAFATKHLKES